MVKVTYTSKARYQNPLAGKLGLGSDDLKREAKLSRLLEDLETKIHKPVAGDVVWHVMEAQGTGALPLPNDWQEWPILTPRTVWGKTQAHIWLVTKIAVPEEAAAATLVLSVSANWRPMQGSTDPQCLAYLDGKIAQALDGNHTDLVIARKAISGQFHLVQINAFTFDERPMVGFQSGLLVRDERVEALYHCLATAFNVAVRLPQTDGRRHQLLKQVESALFALDRREGQELSFLQSLPAAEAIAEEIYTRASDTSQPTVSAFGHTHLDVAWLWRIKHVRDKAARSFATVLNLMDEFPGFVFMYNQAAIFHFLKQDYPEIWQRLKEKVATGQFEVEGAMWVEPDVNISSGEALIRQIMRGRQFHIDEFGITPRCVWLPDTFGYSAALPQIFVKSGIDFFVTSKLSWNDTDRQPSDSFFWRGIDGSAIKSQLITTQSVETVDQRTIYNSAFDVSDIMGTWKRYEPKAQNDEVMMCYGHGDGGGGPTREMVLRGYALERGIPGAPNLRLEGLGPFLDRLAERMEAHKDAFPCWNGELYLQYHRGTLTSVAKNKKNNRNAERAMRELEFVASAAHLVTGRDYPTGAIRDLWDIVLIHQFHDILPGTSIAEVYEDSDAAYAELFAEIESAQGPMQMAINAVCPTRPGQLQLINATGQQRDGEMIELSGADGTGLGIKTGSATTPFQPIYRPDGRNRMIVPVSDVVPLGWSTAQICETSSTPPSSLSISATHLENDLLAVQLDEVGEIISVVDKAKDRELLIPGRPANQLILYEDKPKNYDAWDIDHYFEDKCWFLSNEPARIDVIESGPHRAAIKIERSFARSQITQVISLQEGSRLIEFDTEIDWQERQALLKASFPFDLNVFETRAEIQFGHVKRPSHRNTSWDQARFETSMHRWVDMSEPDFGAAIINDCKYGYDAFEHTLRVTLLKGPVEPDPKADLGLHRFRYALLLHEGEQDISTVVRAAERFNNPVLVRGKIETVPTDIEHAESFSFARATNPNLTIETVKLAENGNGIILRIYEHANRRALSRLEFGRPVESVTEVDMMESAVISQHVVAENGIDLAFRPFEIKTLRATFSS